MAHVTLRIRAAALAAAAVLLAAGLACGGCAGSQIPDEKPGIVNAWVNIIGPTGGGADVTVDVTGSATIIVGTGPVEFCANLDPTPSERWHKASVKVQGGRLEPGTRIARQVALRFSPGKPGEKMVITLNSITLPDGSDGPLVLTLERAEPPVVSLRVATADGAWRDVASGDVLPRESLRLLLSFTRPMNRDGVLAALAMSGLGAAAAWNPDESVSIALASPPSLVRVNLWEVRDARGLPLANGGMWDFYVGEPPRLYSYDPVTGVEAPVCEVMTDLRVGAVSPDGRLLLAETCVRPWGLFRAWLVTLGDGERQELEGQYHIGWVGERSDLVIRVLWTAVPGGHAYELLTVDGRGQGRGSLPEGIRLPFRVSPDGTRLAALVARGSTAGSEDLVRHDLLLVDLRTGESRVSESFVTLYAPPSTYRTPEGQLVSSPVPRGGAYSDVAWSPDASRIAAVSHLDRGSLIRVLDLATWQACEVTLPGVGREAWSALSWSPDGLLWVGGTFAVETGPPNATVDIALTGAGRLLWSPDGRWVARNEAADGWGELQLYRFAGASEAAAPGAAATSAAGGDAWLAPARSLGTAFPCGWDAAGRLYFVRWPDADQRFVEGEGH
jgi:hypothetical protein